MSGNALAVVPQWDDQQLLDTIKETVCRGATPAQFRMFIEVCKSTGLNPFLKEIWYVPSVGVMAARDGYLRIANQHPQFDGMETRVERDEKNIPIKAVCTVWRKDRGHPVIAEAYYNEYKKGGNVWQTYPSAMIAKVAEVLALKRSFAINGVVTEEEIGEQGSKEAQKEYLASKGLEPYVAPKHQANQPPPVAPQTIRELADELDKPPQGIKTIEMRHAKEVAEADQALKEVAKKPARKRGGITFDVLKYFGEIKTLLRETTGDDGVYYQTLRANGYDHADAIKDNDQAREIYRALGQLHKRATEDKKLRIELELAKEHFGDRFMQVLGWAGCESVDDALNLASEPLEELRRAIKELPPMP
jgi:phage recombination protein Bet